MSVSARDTTYFAPKSFKIDVISKDDWKSSPIATTQTLNEGMSIACKLSAFIQFAISALV